MEGFFDILAVTNLSGVITLIIPIGISDIGTGIATTTESCDMAKIRDFRDVAELKDSQDIVKVKDSQSFD